MDVQHELRQRPVKAREASCHQAETRTAQFHGSGEIQQPEVLTNANVIVYWKIE
jgi:hypothetical protein